MRLPKEKAFFKRGNLFYLQKKKTLPFAKREMLHELNTNMA